MTLSLNALLTRTGPDGIPDEYGCTIQFIAVCVSPGCPANRWGASPHNAWADEYEFEITAIYFEDGEPADAPGPLTIPEMATLTAWFDAHYELAAVEAAGNAVEDAYERADFYRLGE